MTRQRKTDKYRLKEGRGTGRKENYLPWLKIHEVPSEGLSSRILGWKNRRIHQLMSNLERDYFFLIQWEDSVIDIREQFPLLPLEETILIAEEFGIRHPSINNQEMKQIVLTTDFVITVDDGNRVRDIARTIKPTSKMNERVREKYEIEEQYWNKRKINWGIVTENEINQQRAKNIRFIYGFYFWDEINGFTKAQIEQIKYNFCDNLTKNDFDITKTAYQFDLLMGWKQGESIGLFKYLLAHKVIKTDMNENIMLLNKIQIKL